MNVCIYPSKQLTLVSNDVFLTYLDFASRLNFRKDIRLYPETEDMEYFAKKEHLKVEGTESIRYCYKCMLQYFIKQYQSGNPKQIREDCAFNYLKRTISLSDAKKMIPFDEYLLLIQHNLVKGEGMILDSTLFIRTPKYASTPLDEIMTFREWCNTISDDDLKNIPNANSKEALILKDIEDRTLVEVVKDYSNDLNNLEKFQYKFTVPLID